MLPSRTLPTRALAAQRAGMRSGSISTTLSTRSTQLATRRFATAPTKSNVFPAPGGAGSLPPPPPPKARKSLTRRILSPLILLTVAFYGVSVPLGYLSLRYRDFLVETVPGGEQIGDLLDEIQVSRAKGTPTPAAPGTPKGPGKETELTRWAESRARAEGWKVKKPEPTDPETARHEIKERLAKEAKKAEAATKGKVTDIVEAAKARASEVKQVAVKAEGVVEDKAKQAVHAAQDLASAAPAAVSKVAHDATAPSPSSSAAPAPVVDEAASKLPVYAQRPRELDATPIPPKRASNEIYQGPPLPIGFEPAPGYELPRAPPAPKGDLKPATPPPPPLPLVAPALKDVTVQEPVLGQLAATIDSLAQYVEKHDVTASASATTVLSGAQKDIKSLAARIEGIKKQEEDKLAAQLKEQAQKYSGLLVKAEKELVERLDTQEEDWKRAFDDERERLVKAYKDKLDTELATQQELINQRLKEEVIQQGIELQRRWVSEVKTRVEQERGGRLAKLEELESGVRKLEKVAKENEDALGEAVRARKIFTAVKALEHKVESGAPFAAELATLQRLAAHPTSSDSAKEASPSDSLLSLALSTIPTEVASTGVSSFPALAARFTESVAPQLKKVSLLPEHGGLVAYLTSVVGSHALFEKEGWADGEDVVSTVARVKFWLANKDLDLAAREANSLSGWPKALAADWLQQARSHLAVKQALEVAEREATAENLKAI
ncbi:mitochondrial inner membrane protein Mitofilin [Rhodotorula diobovata]|uniref:MICOS complex subunit MIC60 n=1 Tax=Rhodotorula diobovata TaxID=5288 RepID=A0A5C5G1C3_9BASI|nr:mitochondrial inner membrane protein Mitofilin [Rhodotorula diobovata]